MCSRPSGTVYLVPNTLGGDPDDTISRGALTTARELNYWVVEDAKVARRFLKSIAPGKSLPSIRILTLNRDSPPEFLDQLLDPVAAGEDVGVLSDAGCPGIADPGADLVRAAHLRGLRIVPLVGPSSILLALMASGMNGQHFMFHGYLPVDADLLKQKIREVEGASRRNNRTEIFIETPYRNERILKHLIATLSGDTQLCIASNLTTPDQRVRTMTVSAWSKIENPVVNDSPCVYLVFAPGSLPIIGKKHAPPRKSSKVRR